MTRDRPLRDVVTRFYRKRMGVFPNLDNPQGYNDKIQWLKIYGQHEDMPTCCDKLAVRIYVADRLGTMFAMPVYDCAKRFELLPPIWRETPCIVKPNHDSGTRHFIYSENDVPDAAKKINRALQRVYGVNKGEWAYARVNPYVLAEPIMPEPVTDYKFHCADGKVVWQQTIQNRAPRPSLYAEEVITDRHGNVLPLHFDQNHVPVKDWSKPDEWEIMVDAAEVLARPFKYVRVDFYLAWQSVLVGEITFWPNSGCYTTADEPAFGEMLQFDMTPGPVLHD